MKRQWKIATILGLVVIACGVYTWGIPAVINVQAHKNYIEGVIKEKSGLTIDIGNPKLSMGTFPSVWLKSDNISVLNDDNSKALSIDNPKLKLKLFPLLLKRIEISKLSADNEVAYFSLTEDSKFKLGQYYISEINRNKDKKFTLAKMDLQLGEYNIYLDDKKNNQEVELNGKYFKHGKYVKNKHVKFATENSLKIGEKKTDLFANIDIQLPIDRISEDKLNISADLKDFDIASISDYSSILTGGKIKSLSGVVNFNAITEPDKFGHKKIRTELQTSGLEIIGKDSASSVVYHNPLKANINFSTVENGINFEEVTLNSEKIHAKAKGKVFDLGNKSIKYNLEAEVKDTRLEDVVAILPWNEKLLPDFNLYKLKKHVFYGNGEGKVKFVGQGNRPNVTGEIKLWDCYLIHPMRGAKSNAKVNMKFIGKNMLLDVLVPGMNNQEVIVKGDVHIDGSKYSELNIKSTDSVDLASAQEILVPLHEVLKFQVGPVSVMKIAGLGSINIRSAGKKVDPHIWGRIDFRDVTTSFNDIHNLVLYNGAGEVVFNDTQTTFRNYKGYIFNRPIEIKGDCSVLGKLNVYITSNGHKINNLVNVINSSPILVDVQKAIKPFTNPEGTADVFLQIYGTAKNAEEVVFNEDLFSKGKITLHNAKTIMQDTFLPFTKVNGVVNFDKETSDYDVTGFVRDSKLHVYGTGTKSQIDLKAHSDKFVLNDIFDLLNQEVKMPYQKEIGLINASFNGSYKGSADADNIDYNKIIVDGKFIPNMNTSNPIKLNGGTFNIKNGFLKTSSLSGVFHENPCSLKFTAKDLDKDIMSIVDAVFSFKNFDISTINTMLNQVNLPEEMAFLANDISDIKGITDINGSIHDNVMNAKMNLSGTSFVYKPLGAVIRVLSGSADIKNNVLYLDKINSRLSSMPVFVNGKISNIYNNPNLNLTVSTKLTQQFFDRLFNEKSIYPVKVKGDVNFYTKLTGPMNAISSKSNLNIEENASIYYMGATLAGAPSGTVNSEGITTNPISIDTDAVLYPNKIKINSMHYNQIISSQNKKKSIQNQLEASGELSLLKNNIIGFNNFKVKTNQPTNARIFNIVFKKPTIKQGVFTTDMVVNGTSEFPYILGVLNISGIDIPLLDSTVRDIDVQFKDDYIYLNSKAVVLTNDINMDAKIVNKAEKPIVVENINVQMDELNMNVVTNAISDFEADRTRARSNTDALELLPPDTVIINNAQINADKILIKKAKATNFQSHIKLDKNQVFKVDDFSFNIANGTVKGNIDYDMKNLHGSGTMSISNADAQIIAENFFDMPGQMYGIVTGNMNASCTGATSVDCINTLSGDGQFEVTDGRMPKLGSLEYLLKAGNLITGGVTGISINGIIDLITPLKTGDFKSISGDIHVKDGIADNINVYSSGKDLNMYMTGSYNIATLVADMEVYGSLSKNFSTLLGKIANSSLNTLFNTIPGININEINPKSTSNINKIPNFDKNNVLRVFRAEIYGDINGTNYVKSFRWIKD